MEEKEVIQKAEQTLSNIGVSQFQTGIAGAVNNTYNYARNSLFYGLVPAYYRDYAWRYIRPSCEWLDGYVYSLHQGGYSGIISTRIGNRLITGLTKQVVGEKLLFKLANKEQDKDTLRFVSNWAKEQEIMKAVFSGVGWGMGNGTSIIKMNKTKDQEIWWQAIRLDNSFFLANFRGQLKDVTFIIRAYTDTRKGHSNEQFYLTEHRYYKVYDKAEIEEQPDGTFKTIHQIGDKESMVEYNVHRIRGSVFNNTMPSNINKSDVKWPEIPQCIRDMIKEDFATIRIDEPQKLGFTGLGCQLLLNGRQDLGVPTAGTFGESLLVPIQSDMITYEIAASYKLRDMYLGKGTVYLPKSLSQSDILIPGNTAKGGVLSGIGEDKYETIKGVPLDQQSILVNQFDIREDQWQVAMDNSLKNIAVKWGMSPKVLASYLAASVAPTATQIDSEDDMSISFLYLERSYFIEPLNKLLEETLNFYGKPNNVTIGFTSPSLVNKDRIIDRMVKLLDEGLITKEDAIREIYPDDDEETIQNKIKTLNELQLKQQLLAMKQQIDVAKAKNEQNDAGNIDNLGGKNLNGSTEVTQQ